MIGRLNHVAIVVPDLSAAATYTNMLGAKVSDPIDLPAHGVTTVFVELPNSKIELLHPLDATSPIQPFLDRHPPAAFTIFVTKSKIFTLPATTYAPRARGF